MMEPMVSSSEGIVDTANVTFWLRTLLQQNSDLVEVVAKLEAGSRCFFCHNKDNAFRMEASYVKCEVVK